MIITLISQIDEYTIESDDKKFGIFLEVDKKNRKISITPKGSESKFLFCGSEPETVSEVEQLIKKAVEIGKFELK